MADPRIVIVGAGPAGTRAAETLVAAGLRPIVVNEAAASGGQIYRRQPPGFTRSAETLYGTEASRATAVHATFDGLVGKIEYRPETLAWNVQDGALHILHGVQASRLPFDALIIATGATDRVMPLPGWTLPGVYSLGASQIALKAQGCAIGRRVAFMGTGPLLYLVASQYVKAGATVVAVLDTSPLSARLRALPLMAARPDVLLKGVGVMLRLRRAGVPIHLGITPVAIEGDGEVALLRATAANGTALEIACDAVGIGYHLRSETQLADLAGCTLAFDAASHQWLPVLDQDGRASVAGIYLAGDGGRILGADGAETAGKLAAYAALADLGRTVPDADIEKLRSSQRRMDRFRRGLAIAFPWPAHLAAALPDETLVCRCEAITAGELRHVATALDAPEVNRAKAFSRVGMGRCQGRFCGLAGAEIVAAARGVGVEQAGRLRGQAPVRPLPIAARVDGA
jgi:NADPH-dependent 2,4-dienoyl-CoA reductase/sulfur reductase-like enzyme